MTQMFTNKLSDKQFVVWPLLGDKKESLMVHKNMADSQNNHAEFKKLDPPQKKYILYDVIYIKL